MGLAPAGGRLLAQLVTGRQPDVDPTPFRVDRYSTEDSDGT
jgi:D-amino-acid dehydrogenase